MGHPTPTREQRSALRKFQSGRSLKISAFAGTGKTTTLSLLARSSRERGLYIAFNKAIAEEAAERFPKEVLCKTTHSLAWRAVQSAHHLSDEKLKGSLQPRQLAELLSLKKRRFATRFELSDVQQAFLLLRTVQRYCQSDDEKIRAAHIPQYGRLFGLPADVLGEVRRWVSSEARRLWTQMRDPSSPVPLGHDGYLKLWAVERPELPFSYILLDEAQDTNAVVLGLLREQPAQIVYVGDRHQQIYEWRGAVSAMDTIEGLEEAHLTESFRFGPAIAEAASQVLRTLGEGRRLKGSAAIDSEIRDEAPVQAVLARTNAALVREVLEAVAGGHRPHIVGGVGELQRLVRDVFDLKGGDTGSSPELFGFSSWPEVEAFAEDEEGEHLQTLVKLVRQHGERKLWASFKGIASDEADADLLLSTAHKAKGREWDAVRLASDFASRRLVRGHPDAPAEVRLFYVALTRAKRLLVADPQMLGLFTSGAWKESDGEGLPRERRPKEAQKRRKKRRPPPPEPTLWQRIASWWSGG